MAITQTNLSGQVAAAGGPPAGQLKVGAINCALGAAETTVTIDWATFGFSAVFIYGFIPRDTHTANAVGWFANHTGVSVVYTWTAADIANVIVYALGV